MFLEIEALISQVGFPIAAFVLIWYQNNTTLAEIKKAVEALKDALLGVQLVRSK